MSRNQVFDCFLQFFCTVFAQLLIILIYLRVHDPLFLAQFSILAVQIYLDCCIFKSCTCRVQAYTLNYHVSLIQMSPLSVAVTSKL